MIGVGGGAEETGQAEPVMKAAIETALSAEADFVVNMPSS
jgi:hypothetical protein